MRIASNNVRNGPSTDAQFVSDGLLRFALLDTSTDRRNVAVRDRSHVAALAHVAHVGNVITCVKMRPAYTSFVVAVVQHPQSARDRAYLKLVPNFVSLGSFSASDPNVPVTGLVRPFPNPTLTKARAVHGHRPVFIDFGPEALLKREPVRLVCSHSIEDDPFGVGPVLLQTGGAPCLSLHSPVQRIRETEQLALIRNFDAASASNDNKMRKDCAQ